MGLTRFGVWCTSLTDVGFLCLCLTVHTHACANAALSAPVPDPVPVRIQNFTDDENLCVFAPPACRPMVLTRSGPHSFSAEWKDLPSTTRLWQWVPPSGSHGQWNRAHLRVSGHMPASTHLWLPLPLDRMFSAAAWHSRCVRSLSSDSSEASDATMADQASLSSSSGSSEGAVCVSQVETPVPWAAAETDWSDLPNAPLPRSRAPAPVEHFLRRLLVGIRRNASVKGRKIFRLRSLRAR